MGGLFAVIILVSFIAIILGLIKPKLVIYWGDQTKKTRGKVFLYYGISFLLSIIILGFIPSSDNTADQEAMADTGSNTAQKHQTTKKDTTKKAIAKTDTTQKIVKKKSTISKDYKIGDWVKAGKLSFKVNSIKNTNQIGDEFLNVKAKGVFLVINMTVKNNDKTSRTIDSNMFKLTSKGSTFETNSEAEAYSNNDGEFLLDALNPGLAVKGNIVFDVPKNLSNVKLQVDSGLWLSGGDYKYINLGF